jgi:hypothetical protein
MPSVNLPHVLAAAAAAFLAGGINSVAGGGTLVSFPTLVWLGLPSITANATSTVAIWPGSLDSKSGFRSEFGQIDPRLKVLSISSLIGGGLGAILLRSTPTQRPPRAADATSDSLWNKTFYRRGSNPEKAHRRQ